MTISTADAARLRKSRLDSEKQENQLPRKPKRWYLKYFASFRVSPWAWIFIILLSLASAVTTGVAFEEFLSGSPGRNCNLEAIFGTNGFSIVNCFSSINGETPRFVSITLAVFLTIATQGILIYASIELSSALLALIRSFQPMEDGANSSAPKRNITHAAFVWLWSVFSRLVVVTFFFGFLLLPLWFSVHFSFATLHRELEDKDEVRREALDRLENDYIVAHKVVRQALEDRYLDLVSSDQLWRVRSPQEGEAGKRLVDFSDNVNKLIDELKAKLPSVLQIGEEDGFAATIFPPSNPTLADTIIHGWKSDAARAAGISEEKIDLEQQDAEIAAEILQLSNLQDDLNDRKIDIASRIEAIDEELSEIRVAIPFEERGCLGSFVENGRREWEVLVNYLLKRDAEKLCNDADNEWIFRVHSKRQTSKAQPDPYAPFLTALSDLSKRDDPAAAKNVNRIQLALRNARSTSDLEVIYLDGDDPNSLSFRSGTNCEPGAGQRWRCLKAREHRLGSEGGELQRERDKLRQIEKDIAATMQSKAAKEAKQTKIRDRIQRLKDLNPDPIESGILSDLIEKDFTEIAKSARDVISRQTIKLTEEAVEADVISQQSFSEVRTSCLVGRNKVLGLIPNDIEDADITGQVDNIFNCELFVVDTDTLANLRSFSELYQTLSSNNCAPGSFGARTSSSVGEGSLAFVAQANARYSNESGSSTQRRHPFHLDTEFEKPPFGQDDPPPSGRGANDLEIDDRIKAYRSSDRIRCLREPLQRAGLSSYVNDCVNDYVTSSTTFDGSSNVNRSFVKLGEFLGASAGFSEKSKNACLLASSENGGQEDVADSSFESENTRRGLNLEEDLFEFGAYAIAWWIDVAVLLLGFLATLRLFRANQTSTSIEDRIRQTIGLDRVAMNDFLSALKLDPGGGMQWWTVFDEKNLKHERNLPIVQRFLSAFNSDIKPVKDCETQYRLSKRLVSALERIVS